MRPVPFTATTETAGFGPAPVWSSGDTTTETFHPLSDLYAGAEVSLVRASLELQHSSGDIELRVAVRYSYTAVYDALRALGSSATSLRDSLADGMIRSPSARPSPAPKAPPMAPRSSMWAS